MTDDRGADGATYTKLAHAAILAAACDQRDFLSWLVGVLTRVAEDLQSTPARSHEPADRRGPEVIQRSIKGGRWDDDLLERDGEHLS